MFELRTPHNSFSLRAKVATTLLSVFFIFGCVKPSGSFDPNPSPTPGTAIDTSQFPDAQWQPQVDGVSVSNFKHASTPNVVSEIVIQNVPFIKISDPWNNKEIAVDLGNYNASDFGPNGSLTLVAQVLDFPYRAGGAYPALVSFTTNDGTEHEWVNFARSGSAGDCKQAGLYSCIGSSCSPNNGCTLNSPSAFPTRDFWEQFQFQPFGYTSVNHFPLCESGSGPWDVSNCASTVSVPMPSGHYIARYVLMTDLTNITPTLKATLKVQVIRKVDLAARNTGSTNGGLQLNVILVGDQNIKDSQTSIGAQNLNLLFKEVHDIYKTNAKIGIGSIRAFNWPDAQGGNQFSSANTDKLGDLFKLGSSKAPTASSGKSINVFIVNDISVGSGGGGVTILGVSGAISGPPINGTEASGLVFASFSSLATYNSTCTVGACPRTSWDNNFIEMGATIAHELGHYLGLNHPSERPESSGYQYHDVLTDTPKCSGRKPASTWILDARACFIDTTNELDHQTCPGACSNYYTGSNSGSNVTTYCGSVPQCQFNHMMWYTTKNRALRSGVWEEDGNLISAQSSAIIQWSALVQ